MFGKRCIGYKNLNHFVFLPFFIIDMTLCCCLVIRIWLISMAYYTNIILYVNVYY